MSTIDSDRANDTLTADRILEAARVQVRRFGEAKTNVVDIAKALGTSHTTIYRHFRSKAEVFDAIVLAAMRDEEFLGATFVEGEAPAADRLQGLVMALHRRKVERFAVDVELYLLYRRVVEDRPELIRRYAEAMTSLVAAILADGVKRGEFTITNIPAAAGVVRDAVTVFIHPAHVQAAAKAGASMELNIRRTMTVLIRAFTAGVTLDEA